MAKSSQERLWLIGGGVGAFVMVLIGYFLLISPQRASTQDVRDQVAAKQLESAALQQHIDELTAQNKDLAKYKSQLAALRLALPSNSGLPDLLRTLQGIGNETLAQVTSLTVGPPTGITAAPAAAPAEPAGTATPTATPTTASTATTEPTSSGTGVYSLSITAQVSGSTKQLGDFLDQLQSVQPRAVLITSVALGAADSSDRSATTMQLTMQAFVAPPVVVPTDTVPAATAPTAAASTAPPT